MQRFGRRGVLSALGGSLCAATSLSLSAGGARGAVKSFIALGDSYTASFRNGIPSWAQQIKNSGVAQQIVNLARSGATITGADYMGTFDGQVDAWIRSYKSQGMPDRTFVYVGYNNIGNAMTTVRNAYSRQIDRLIANGITQSERKLVLCLLHDRSRDPRCPSLSCKNSVRPWVVEWNMFVRSVAASRSNCIVVDLFTQFEDVYNTPNSYGFTNVTTANFELSASTHLYADAGHFGTKGQGIIASTIRPNLVG